MIRLAQADRDLERILSRGPAPPPNTASHIDRRFVQVVMRDGIRLATDLYLPPHLPAPAIAMRTPYGRGLYAPTLLALALRGYVVIAQDCRGTGDSEPDTWDFSIYEPEDSYDFVEWVTHQTWFDGFLAGCGGSYIGQTQWEMPRHPRMSAIVPEVGGFIPAWQPVRFHNFVNAYSRSIGKGANKITIPITEMERHIEEETLSTGYFNDPLEAPLSHKLDARYPILRTLPASDGRRWLWEHFTALGPAERVQFINDAQGQLQGCVTFSSLEALSQIFGHHISHGYPSQFSPGVARLAQSLRAPSLMITGWYDWDLGGTLASWDLMMRECPPEVAARCRLIITPSAHSVPGYREGRDSHPELDRDYRTQDIGDLLLHWYAVVRRDRIDSWPRLVYYLMGANEWRTASAWPPAHGQIRALHLSSGGRLTFWPLADSSEPDTYVYDPTNPTPTVGGSIVSYVYPAGSVDVSKVQQRSDVLTYTTEPVGTPLDVVGPLRLILYASSSAPDTDFVARVSDVFPDGRAIQLQSGILRTRYRNPCGKPELLEPGRVYRLEIDLWATANRFKAGHRLRLDVSSADFPRFERNTNRGGEPGSPISAVQTIYHDSDHPSHLLTTVVLGG